MKKYSVILIMVAILWQPVLAQHGKQGNGNIIKVKHTVNKFSGIDASGIDDIIIYTRPGSYSVAVETDENLQDKISLKIKNGVLNFSYSNIKPEKLKFHVTAPYIDFIEASGASDIKTADTIKTEKLKIKGSGAADIRINSITDELDIEAGGAADFHLTGTTNKQYIEAGGAADVKSGACTADSVFAKAEGASTVIVNPVKYLNKKVSGAADIKLSKKAKNKTIVKINQGNPNQIVVHSSEGGNYSDTADIKIGSIEVKVIDGDTTKIKIGNHMLIVNDDGDVNFTRCKSKKFTGHWGGVELGINGYVTPDFSSDFGKAYDYLSLRYEKSIAVNLNLWEQDFSLNKAKTLGFVTGLGLSFNNYRFSQPTYLSPDSLNLSGFYMTGVNVRKTKLTSMYITMPLIFEVQTNNLRNSKRFHFSVGAILNARVRTHTKIYFNEANKQYRLEDPVTGIPSFNYYTTPNNTNRNIVKSFDSFSMQPFRVDATARMGFGPINIFATYGLTQMFQKNRGPELYNWVVGISFVGW